MDSDGEEHEEVVSVSDEGAGQWEEFEGSDSEDDSEIRSIVSEGMNERSCLVEL